MSRKQQKGRWGQDGRFPAGEGWQERDCRRVWGRPVSGSASARGCVGRAGRAGWEPMSGPTVAGLTLTGLSCVSVTPPR